MLAGCLDLPEISRSFLVSVVLGIFQQHLAVADDGVHRRAQLVAHVGQEDALGSRCSLGRFFGFEYLVLGLLPGRDVAHHVDRAIAEHARRKLAVSKASIFAPNDRFSRIDFSVRGPRCGAALNDFLGPCLALVLVGSR